MNQYFESYKNSLIKEIENFSADKAININTIYIGGGTPSIIPPEFIGDIIGALDKNFTIESGTEISIETNPGTIDSNKLLYYRSSGINRISIGIQSFNDRLLKVIGRIHTGKEAVESFKTAKKAGFNNINIDLMFALPSQTLKEWEETLDIAINLNPSHLSVYSLIIEEETPFHDMLKENKITLISDELDRAMYYKAKETLKKAGYKQYEFSNFSKNGYECKHNIVYWKRKEYIGFGLGACSFFRGKRFHNNYNLTEYINGNHFGEFEEISQNDAYAEYMFLGLRMTKGVSREEFLNYFGKTPDELYGDIFKKFIKLGFLEDNGERLFLTPKGIDLSNVLFQEFL